MAAKLFKRAACGFVLGMVVGALMVVAISFASGNGSLILPAKLLKMTGTEAGALLAHMLASGAYGTIPMAGTLLYELDSWGLLKQAIVHYTSYTAAFMCFGIAFGWIEPTLVDIGIMAGTFAVCHCIIWLIMYNRYRSEVKRLNELLAKTKTP